MNRTRTKRQQCILSALGSDQINWSAGVEAPNVTLRINTSGQHHHSSNKSITGCSWYVAEKGVGCWCEFDKVNAMASEFMDSRFTSYSQSV